MNLQTEELTGKGAEAAHTPLTDQGMPLSLRDLVGGSTPGELDLFPFLLLLRSHLWRTLGFALLGLLIAAGYAYTRKPLFVASGSVLIPQESSAPAGSAALQAFAGLGLISAGAGTGPGELTVDLLRSRTVADRLIEQYRLEAHWKAPIIEVAEAKLAERTAISAARDGIVSISVSDEDPKLAAKIATSYFDELSVLNTHLESTEAEHLRNYYAGQMAKEKDALSDAEALLAKSQKQNGILEPQQLAGAGLGAEESTRAQLRTLQIQLTAVLQGATPQNPEVVRLKSEIAGLEGQLQEFQSKGGLGVGIPNNQQPEQALDYFHKERDVKLHEALLDAVTHQYESASQQASKELSMVEVLDPPRPTPGSVWPPSRRWMEMGAALGLLAGIFWTCIEAVVTVVLANPVNRSRVEILLHGRSPSSLSS